MNYLILKDEIKAYCNRNDTFFISQIENFINQAINRIYSEAKNIGFQQYTINNLVFQSGQALLTKPTNWKETVSFQYTSGVTEGSPYTNILLLRSYEFCKMYSPNSNVLGSPLFYADKDYSNFLLAPTPAQDYPYTLIYLGLPLFDTLHQTNFLTERYPNLLLYSSLIEAFSFTRNKERFEEFKALYGQALQDINTDAKKLYTDRGSIRDVT